MRKQFQRLTVEIFLGILLVASMGTQLACGGGSSNSTPSSTPNPAPTLSSVDPTALPRGSFNSVSLALRGINFIPASVVNWNGAPHSSSYISQTALSILVTPSELLVAGNIPVMVTNPSPGGGSSTSIVVTIQDPNPTPSLSFISPSTATAGGSSFTLQVNGGSFLGSSIINWNGTPRPTTYVSSSTLTAQISAADIANTGTILVTVTNPTPGGGTSSSVPFNVGGIVGSGVAIRSVSQLARQMVWDPAHQVIYLSVPSFAGSTGNSIAVLNPTSGTITASQFAGSEPNLLAISDDGSVLYVSLDGASNVKRFTLPNLTFDLQIDLGTDSFFGPFWAKDLQVAPSSANTIAVSLGANRGGSPEAIGGVAIFDGAAQRPVSARGWGSTGTGPSALYDSLQWGSDATQLFAANNESTGFDFYTLAVSSTGVSQTHDYGSVFSSFYAKIHYDRGSNLVYSEDGHVVDPVTGHPVGTFAAQGLVAPDSSINRVFFLGQTQAQFGSANFTIVSFDLSHFTPVGYITIQGVQGNPIQLLRYGSNGLAFNTTAGMVYLVNGGFIAPTASAESLFRFW